MRIAWISGAIVLCFGGVAAVRAANPSTDLPAGPIRDRHELMEGIGNNAKTIGDALKAGNTAPVVVAAEQIQRDAGRITALFPSGSTHQKSRAKAEIWQNWAKFEGGAKDLQTTAAALVVVARSGGDVRGGAQAMFDTCKSCHDQFRIPEKQG
ncbi:MAG: cytochrome c [Deltaproteobacteria bacterium]|nr:cytochrome c [Deltaproteobacteria bacterium]